MSSGIIVNPEVASMLSNLGAGKKEFRYAIFKITDREVVLESAVTQNELGAIDDDYADSSKATFEKFAQDLKTRTNSFSDCRYAIFDFKFTSVRMGAGVAKMGKLVFVQLCPDGASIKARMLYASSASALKNALGSVKLLQFQVTDESEMSHATLLVKLRELYGDN